MSSKPLPYFQNECDTTSFLCTTCSHLLWYIFRYSLLRGKPTVNQPPVSRSSHIAQKKNTDYSKCIMYSEVMSTFKRTFYGKTGNIKIQVNKSNVHNCFRLLKCASRLYIIYFKQQFGSRFTASSSFHRSQQTRQSFSSECSTFCNFPFLPFMTRLFFPS